MAEPFIGEIRIMSFGFAPKDWAQCNGQLLPINQNQVLFSLLGTTYGGDGRVNFALPNLQGRVPINQGQGHTLGERGGEQNHTLTIAELPAHTHPEQASGADGNTPNSTGHVLAQAKDLYAAGNAPAIGLHPNSVTSMGGGQAHANMQPYLTLNFCIALQGIFPSQN